jgi:hypothetical protein
MAKLIGRKFNIVIVTDTTRGTAVAAAYWLPKLDASLDEKIEYATDETSVGVIADAQGQDITKKISEGSISGRIADTSFGLWLIATFGTASAPAAILSAFDHTFTVLESAQHPSLTVSVTGANENAGNGLRYTLGSVDNLEINFELGKYAEYKVGFRGNKSATATNTASFTAENVFLPQHGSVKFATNLAGLTGASAIQIKKATLKFSKNIEDDQVIGTLDSIDRLNKQFAVEGSIELMYEDRTYIDTIMLGDLQRALRIAFTNTDVTIGSTNPAITFDMAKVKLTEVARSMSNNDLMKQTLNFKAYYSITDSSMITCVLRNTRATQY